MVQKMTKKLTLLFALSCIFMVGLIALYQQNDPDGKIQN